MTQHEIAELIRRLSTGIYGIGVCHEGQQGIFTASWVMPASFDPVLVAVSVNPKNRSYELMTRSGVFSINVIDQDHPELAEQMAAPGDRLESLSWMSGKDGCPLIRDALAHLECRVISEYPAGDHQIFIAELRGGRLLDAHAEPLLYHETGNLDGAVSLFPEQLNEDLSPAHEPMQDPGR